MERLTTFRDFVERLNRDLTQEAIGAQFNNRGSLIYDPNFKGERYTFSNEYFKQPTSSRAVEVQTAQEAAPGITPRPDRPVSDNSAD